MKNPPAPPSRRRRRHQPRRRSMECVRAREGDVYKE